MPAVKLADLGIQKTRDNLLLVVCDFESSQMHLGTQTWLCRWKGEVGYQKQKDVGLMAAPVEVRTLDPKPFIANVGRGLRGTLTS